MLPRPSCTTKFNTTVTIRHCLSHGALRCKACKRRVCLACLISTLYLTSATFFLPHLMRKMSMSLPIPIHHRLNLTPSTPFIMPFPVRSPHSHRLLRPPPPSRFQSRLRATVPTDLSNHPLLKVPPPTLRAGHISAEIQAAGDPSYPARMRDDMLQRCTAPGALLYSDAPVAKNMPARAGTTIAATSALAILHQ